MLKEINLNEYKWQVDDVRQYEALKEIDTATKKYGKVVIKEKTTAKGKFIVIYAYDKSLYRNIIVNSIQIE